MWDRPDGKDAFAKATLERRGFPSLSYRIELVEMSCVGAARVRISSSKLNAKSLHPFIAENDAIGQARSSVATDGWQRRTGEQMNSSLR
jgi:ATP-dependent Zn protease